MRGLEGPGDPAPSQRGEVSSATQTPALSSVQLSRPSVVSRGRHHLCQAAGVAVDRAGLSPGGGGGRIGFLNHFRGPTACGAVGEREQS